MCGIISSSQGVCLGQSQYEKNILRLVVFALAICYYQVNKASIAVLSLVTTTVVEEE